MPVKNVIFSPEFGGKETLQSHPWRDLSLFLGLTRVRVFQNRGELHVIFNWKTVSIRIAFISFAVAFVFVVID